MDYLGPGLEAHLQRGDLTALSVGAGLDPNSRRLRSGPTGCKGKQSIQYAQDLDNIANEYKSDKVAYYTRIEPEWPHISHIYFTDNYYTFVKLRVNQLEELNNETKSN